MGYLTEFEGALTLMPPASLQQVEYLKVFSMSRHVKRDVKMLWRQFRGEHGNPFVHREQTYGNEGEYFAKEEDGENFLEEMKDPSIIDYNSSPGCPKYACRDYIQLKRDAVEKGAMPDLYCGWIVCQDGSKLEWNEEEKFYSYVEWLNYLVKHFFEPWGIALNGEILWQGESESDKGRIRVEQNVITQEKRA